PILTMARHIPDIQEKLRSDYEGFAEDQVPALQITSLTDAPKLASEVRWRFETANRRAGYILQNASFVYHTTDYSEFEDFVKETLEGFRVIANLADIRRFHRVGLRYVDLIEGESNLPVEALLHPSLEGFGKELRGVTKQFS